MNQTKVSFLWNKNVITVHKHIFSLHTRQCSDWRQQGGLELRSFQINSKSSTRRRHKANCSFHVFRIISFDRSVLYNTDHLAYAPPQNQDIYDILTSFSHLESESSFTFCKYVSGELEKGAFKTTMLPVWWLGPYEKHARFLWLGPWHCIFVVAKWW